MKTILTHLLKLVAYEGERLENRFRVSGNCDNSLWAAAIADVDFCAALRKKYEISNRTKVSLDFLPLVTALAFVTH